MKKIYFALLLFLFFFEGFAQIWINPLTTGRPIASYYLGDRLPSNWYFNFEIGQTWWNASEVGIGNTTDGSTGWSWSSADWYQDGTGSNKRVRRNIGNFQFTASGEWYVVGRAKSYSGDAWTYADEGTWTNNTALFANNSSGYCPYFYVNALVSPSSVSAITNSETQISLTWTPWNSRNVMIVRRLTSSANNNVPVAGTAYSVGVGAPQLGSGTVIYNGSGTSFIDTGLSPGVGYTYTFYSENYSYYSSGTSCFGATSTTWNGASWSNSSGPTSSLDAIIAGNYSTTTNGVFSAKTLTVNSGKSFTINTGHNITVAGAVTNNNGTLTISNNANLIQTDVAATNTGSIIVNRDSANIQLYDYTLWSSPVASQQLLAFSPSTLATRFYTYNSSTNQYNAVSSPSTTNFDVGTGYLIRAPNNWVAGATAAPFEGQFTGVPNNGTVNLTGLTSNAFYALGNPYPSTISANSFISGNSTGGTLYFWRKTNNALNPSYATYTTAGGVSNTDGGSSLSPNGTIQVGQGFIVKATSTSLTFNNTMRTANNANQFLKSSEEKSRFWLNLTSSTGYFCQTMVAYMSQATTGIDNGIDGLYFNDSPTALTSIIDAAEFAIQGKPLPFDTNDTVPLGFKTNAAGNFSIGIDHVDGLFSNGQTIYLKDNLTNTAHNLSSGDYSFASDAGTYNSRFEIVYQSALVLPTFTANNVIVYSHNGEVTINSGKTPMNQVRIFDVRGRLLAEKNHINATETKLTVGAQNQVLLVKIGTTEGGEVTKKIIQ